jgi:hypothetical protein
MGWRPGPAPFGEERGPHINFRVQCHCRFRPDASRRRIGSSPDDITARQGSWSRHLWSRGRSQPCTLPALRTPETVGSAKDTRHHLAPIAIPQRSLVETVYARGAARRNRSGQLLGNIAQDQEREAIPSLALLSPIPCVLLARTDPARRGLACSLARSARQYSNRAISKKP